MKKKNNNNYLYEYVKEKCVFHDIELVKEQVLESIKDKNFSRLLKTIIHKELKRIESSRCKYYWYKRERFFIAIINAIVLNFKTSEKTSDTCTGEVCDDRYWTVAEKLKGIDLDKVEKQFKLYFCKLPKGENNE